MGVNHAKNDENRRGDNMRPIKYLQLNPTLDIQSDFMCGHSIARFPGELDAIMNGNLDAEILQGRGLGTSPDVSFYHPVLKR